MGFMRNYLIGRPIKAGVWNSWWINLQENRIATEL